MSTTKFRDSLGIGLLAVLAVLWNFHAPTVFFDAQIMLGGSLAVFALMQFGWPGLFVGVAALAVTFVRWGHPYELIIGTGFLVWLKIFLDGFNGGPGNNDNGRVVFAAIIYWIVVGIPLEVLLFNKVFHLELVTSVSLGLKEAVTGTFNTIIALVGYTAVQIWRARGRPGAVPVRGFTFCSLLLAVTVPGILITLVLSHQLKTASLVAHLTKLRNFGLEAADLVQDNQTAQIPDLAGIKEGMDFQWRSADGRTISSNPELFEKLARHFTLDEPSRTHLAGLDIYKPASEDPVLLASLSSYWFTRWELETHDAELTVVQPTPGLIAKLDSELLLPSFSILFLLLFLGAAASETWGAIVDRQFRLITNPLLGTRPSASLPLLGSSKIRELNTLVEAINARSLRVNELGASIRKANEEFTRLIRGLPIAVATNTLDPDPKITFLNERFVEIFGYTLDDIPTTAEWGVRAYPDEVYRKQVFEKWNQAISRSLEAKGHIESMEFKVTCKDGTVRETLFRAVALVDRLVVVMVDLTESRLAEKKVRDAQAAARAELLVRERMSLAASAAKAAFWDWDLASNKVTWSEEMKALFGVDPAKTGPDFDTWKAWRSILHPDDLPAAERETMAAVRDLKPLALDYRIVTPDGSIHWIETKGDICRDHNGKAERLAGISQDVTERREIEIELAGYRSELERLLRERTDELDAVRRKLEHTAYELTENIPVGTYTMALPPGGSMAHFSFMSEKFLELSGLDREAARANPLNAFACVHPEEYDEWVRKNAEAFEKKLPFFGETRIVVRGEVRWISAESKPRELPDGSTVWEGVLIDITDRKMSEEKLRQSEERYRSFFNLPLVGTAITARQKGWLEVNDATCRILGYSREELFSKTWSEITHPDDVAKDNEQFTRMLNREIEGYTLEKRFIRKDGSVVHTILSGGCGDTMDTAPEVFYVNILDISARRKLEEELQRSEERYRLLADNSADVIWLLDLPTARFIYVSPAVERLRGFTVEEVLQQDLKDVMTPESRRMIEESLPGRLAAFAAGDEAARVQTHEIIQTRKDGSLVPTEVTTTLLSDANGQARRILGISRDISERKAIEAELDTAREREKQAEEHARHTLERKLKSSLAASAVAHEINQPLSRILLKARMTLEKSSEARDTLQPIIADAERVVTTIEKMRVLLRNVETKHHPVDLAQVVRSSLFQIKQLLSRAKIHVNYAKPAQDCMVRGDDVQLQMAVTNLLRNAIDAIIHHGGDQREIAIDLIHTPGKIVLVVGDSGPGWPGGTLDEVLLNTSKPAGAGIGLYIVKTTVEHHRGTIEVGRSPLGGAEFRLTFERVSQGYPAAGT